MLVQSLLQWKSNMYYMFWMCFCSFRYPAGNTHAPHCHLWPAWLYSIFSKLSNKRHYFKKKSVINIKGFVWVPLKPFAWNIFHSRKNLWKYDQKCILVFMYRNRYSCRILMKLFLKNMHKSNFITIRSVGAGLFHTEGRTYGRTGGRTDRQTDRQTARYTWRS